jgi:phosphohistidine phosphatase
MQLYILRHGQAEPFNSSDFTRELTAKGQADAAALGRHLSKQGLSIDRALVSPLLRTQQTFAAFTKKFGEIAHSDTELLRSESDVIETVKFLADFCQQKSPEALLLVSHQPLVSSLISYLITGSMQEAYSYPMAPASFTALELEIVEAGTASLNYQLHAPFDKA